MTNSSHLFSRYGKQQLRYSDGGHETTKNLRGSGKNSALLLTGDGGSVSKTREEFDAQPLGKLQKPWRIPGDYERQAHQSTA